ncbi:hypothetical protein [Heterosigma akashiwo virus 01]|jgi:hypothetical protein|uniref:Uncharacterized protein n=1 Tax=Heterosigma akashiwo virus 01 TaxID=97195 RepID=A0A1C9C5G3_HAV01|nr:hypothetical protein D1R72_gp198 [Heterosigma akashiwo virus 01]AOM63529.1 hypothetical protein [Heterosigma akashiwo virus 01]
MAFNIIRKISEDKYLWKNLKTFLFFDTEEEYVIYVHDKTGEILNRILYDGYIKSNITEETFDQQYDKFSKYIKKIVKLYDDIILQFPLVIDEQSILHVKRTELSVTLRNHLNMAITFFIANVSDYIEKYKLYVKNSSEKNKISNIISELKETITKGCLFEITIGKNLFTNLSIRLLSMLDVYIRLHL